MLRKRSSAYVEEHEVEDNGVEAGEDEDESEAGASAADTQATAGTIL